MEVKMRIQENTNFSATVLLNDNGIDTPVMHLGASLDANALNVNIICNVANKELYKANAAEMKEKYNEFKAAVESRAKELGYEIF